MKKLVLGLVLALSWLFGGEMVYLEISGKNLPIRLDESEFSLDLLSKLPLNLNFSDYANSEKIAYLPQKLSGNKGTENYEPQGENGKAQSENYEPQRGDLFYFTPWGNVGIFYEKVPPHHALVRLGRLVNLSDLELLKARKGEFKGVLRK